MNFHKCFLDLLNNSSFPKNELVENLSVSEETFRRWMTGKLLPGRGKLEILLNHIQPQEKIRNRLIHLHLTESKKAPKWGEKTNKFAKHFTEICDFYTVSKISNLTGISHQNISNWKCGKLLPSTANIEKISNSLRLDLETVEVLIRLRNEQKVSTPYGRRKKTFKDEETAISEIKKQLPRKFISKSTVRYVNFFYKSIPVMINFKTSNYEVLFTRCCLNMMRANLDTIYLLVDEPLPNPYAELYQNYRITIYTPDEFLKKKNNI